VSIGAFAVSIAALAVSIAAFEVSAVAALFSPELQAAIKPATAKIANTFFIVLVFEFF
jgi:hypothetical protein